MEAETCTAEIETKVEVEHIGRPCTGSGPREFICNVSVMADMHFLLCFIFVTWRIYIYIIM